MQVWRWHVTMAASILSPTIAIDAGAASEALATAGAINAFSTRAASQTGHCSRPPADCRSKSEPERNQPSKPWPQDVQRSE